MYLITVYNIPKREYWTPVLAHSQFAVEQFTQQTFRNNKRVVLRVDTVTDDAVIENLKQQGAKTVSYHKLASGQWAWVAK